jgi:hypothetical protein
MEVFFDLVIVAFTHLGNNFAYRHGLHFCQEVYLI